MDDVARPCYIDGVDVVHIDLLVIGIYWVVIWESGTVNRPGARGLCASDREENLKG